MFVGFSIKSGQIDLSQEPQEVLGKLTIPAGATCAVALQLAPPASPDSKAAKNVAEARAQLPGKVSFHFSRKEKGVDAVGRAGWRLYSQQLTFAWDYQQPVYEATLKGVLVPLNADAQELTVRKTQSPFAQVEGGAVIKQSAWLLPVATIDLDQPTAVGGNGGLALQGNSSLTLSWRGLRDGWSPPSSSTRSLPASATSSAIAGRSARP